MAQLNGKTGKFQSRGGRGRTVLNKGVIGEVGLNAAGGSEGRGERKTKKKCIKEHGSQKKKKGEGKEKGGDCRNAATKQELVSSDTRVKFTYVT